MPLKSLGFAFIAKVGIVIEQVATFPDNGWKIQEGYYRLQPGVFPGTLSNSSTVRYDTNR